MNSSVIIRQTEDDRIDIIYCPPNSLQARVLNVPKDAFLDACTEFADSIEKKEQT